MKYLYTLLLIILAIPAVAFAQTEGEPNPGSTPPQQLTEVTMDITSPSNNSTVGSVFTITGTLSQPCQLSDTVYLQDNTTSGSENYRNPYDPSASHSYSIVSKPQLNGTKFSYTVDLSKAYWNVFGNDIPSGSNLVPQVPQPGKAKVYISNGYQPDSTCYTNGMLEVTIKYPAMVQATRGERPKPVPSQLVEAIKTPSPSPSISVKPPETADTKEASNKVPAWWVAVALVLGGAVVGGAEYLVHHRGKPTQK